MPKAMQSEAHVLSFEGPDPYAWAGGLATRVTGLTRALAARGHATHLWFVGDPSAPGHEARHGVQLHRWCQWISEHHPAGVYDGEQGKANDYARSLPPWIFARISQSLLEGKRVVVLAEEHQTVGAVLHLDDLLRRAGLREQARILWNANNTFGFEHIDWGALAHAATITTVSQYMKRRMRELTGVEATVIPNGLDESAFDAVDDSQLRKLRRRFQKRLLLSKVARFDPDKRWVQAVDAVRLLKASGERPLLVARGGMESHGREVLARAETLGLRTVRRELPKAGAEGILDALKYLKDADVLLVDSHLDADAKRLLFRASNAVLSNSAHEPFGLVGLETMAAGGVALTGCTGEDYAEPMKNALVVRTGDPDEVARSIRWVVTHRDEARKLRRAARRTAERYAWRNVIDERLAPTL